MAFSKVSPLYRYLSTSRGVGNNSCAFFHKSFIFCIRTYLPREGPETQTHDIQFLYAHKLRIDTYPPREGPETLVVQEYELLPSLQV